MALPRGETAPAVAVADGVEALVQHASDRLAALATGHAADRISLLELRDELLSVIKSTNVAAAIAAYGGRGELTKSDWGHTGSMVRTQYGYARGLINDLALGRQSTNGLANRMRMYSTSGRVMYQAANRRRQNAMGVAYERNTLHAAESCSECVAQSARGWVRIGDLVPIGQRLCRGNCRCSLEFQGRTAVAANEPLDFFNPSHDAKGKFAPHGSGGGGGIRLTATTTRAYTGTRVELKNKLTNQESGALGERIILAHFKQLGHADAKPLNAAKPNYAVDGVFNHSAIEMKTGLVSNNPGSRHWRATIGEPGPAEKAFKATLSKTELSRWTQEKNARILERKQQAVEEVSAAVGHPVRGRTVTAILNPDTRTADLYAFEGFHLRIGWNSKAARAGYIGSYHYDE